MEQKGSGEEIKEKTYIRFADDITIALLGVQQQALYLLTWTAGSMSWIDPGE
jgi:hypothetical protein